MVPLAIEDSCCTLGTPLHDTLPDEDKGEKEKQSKNNSYQHYHENGNYQTGNARHPTLALQRFGGFRSGVAADDTHGQGGTREDRARPPM